MTGRTIVILAVAATVCLATGARLLDSGTPSTATLGTTALAIAALAIGTALAATAVAGAWRPPARQAEPEPTRSRVP